MSSTDSEARKSGWKSNLVLLFASIIISVILLEVLASFKIDRLGPSFSPSIYSGDLRNGYGLRRDFQGHVQIRDGGRTTVTVGSYGQRCNSATPCGSEPSAISAFGDSYTFGWGVEDNQTWPALLEQYGDRTVQNFGVGGYNLEKTRLNLEERNRRGLVAQTVVIGISYNDLEEGSEIFDKRVVDGVLVRWHSSSRLVSLRQNPLVQGSHIGSLVFNILSRRPVQDNARDLVADSSRSLEHLITSQSLEGRDVVLLFFNTPSHIKQIANGNFSGEEIKAFYPKNYEKLEALAAREKFTVIDITNPLAVAYRENPSHTYLFVKNDQHYNGTANKLISNMIAEKLLNLN